MATDIQVFSNDQLKARVQDSVRSTFGMLIPDDQWSALIERETRAFFDEPGATFTAVTVQSPGSYGRGTEELQARLTPFRAMVWAEIATIIQPRLQGLIAGPEFTAMIEHSWNTGAPAIRSELTAAQQEHLESVLPKMAAALFRNLYAEAVNQASRSAQMMFGAMGANPPAPPAEPPGAA